MATPVAIPFATSEQNDAERAQTLAHGHTGAAAGQGFYDWTQGKSAADVKARRDAFLVHLLQQERRT